MSSDRTDNKDAGVEPCCDQHTTPEGKLDARCPHGDTNAVYADGCPQCGAKAERERIVSWLRAEWSKAWPDLINWPANEIERGAHHER